MNIPYTKHEVTADDVAAVLETLESNVLTNGAAIQMFEENFSKTVDSTYAVGVSSGSAGLHLAVSALGVLPGETVIVPSLTFAATANAAIYNGANVEFVDIDPGTLLMDVDRVGQLLQSSPKKYAGVIAVDFAGYPIDAKSISDLCHRYGKWFVEDAAHALGAVSMRHGESVKVGNSEYADATVFSFHPAKHITTGEGGMVTTRDAEIDRKLRLLRSHSMDKSVKQANDEGWFYEISEVGYNYRLSEINAALGNSQLARLAGNLSARHVIAEEYQQAFAGTSVELPLYDDNQVNAYHLFIVRVQNRRMVYDALKERGIFAQVHYVPLHMQPSYKGMARHDMTHTENYYDECLSIPMFPTLLPGERAYVIDSLVEITR